jgi:hypothetical protein
MSDVIDLDAVRAMRQASYFSPESIDLGRRLAAALEAGEPVDQDELARFQALFLVESLFHLHPWLQEALKPDAGWHAIYDVMIADATWRSVATTFLAMMFAGTRPFDNTDTVLALAQIYGIALEPLAHGDFFGASPTAGMKA